MQTDYISNITYSQNGAIVNMIPSSLTSSLKSALQPAHEVRESAPSRHSSCSTVSTFASDTSEVCFQNAMIFYVTAKKSVSFKESISLRSAPSRKDFTAEEKRAAWFCSAEYDEIRKSCSRQVMRIERGDILKDVKYSSRGLESYTRRASRVKKQNREAAYIAVLDYGGQIYHSGSEEEGAYRECDDEQSISQRYHRISSSCQLWASAVALRDQMAAEAYLFDVDD
jgi:hypothetical protein